MRHMGNMMLAALAAAVLAANTVATGAMAQDQTTAGGRGPVVVELYTSQGCSSCPPADALMHELAARPDVLALALHVDYWDYIGWADVFAHPRHTARQKAYAKAMQQRTIYTPQMVVGGQDDVVGTHPQDVAALIAREAARTGPVQLSAERVTDGITIRASSAAAFVSPLTVQLVRYRPLAKVEITRGENAGRTFEYANIVTDWQVIGQWDGQAPLVVTHPVAGPDPVVVILQRPGPGAIEAAARLR